MKVTLAAARRLGRFVGMTQQIDALVVGAGVIGLTAAISLAEAGLTTRVVAAGPPGRTTSFAAGAIWGPVRAGGGRVREWAQAGLEVLSELAGDPRAAIRQVSGVLVASAPEPAPDWLALVPHQRPLTAAELPAGIACGWRYTAPVVTMPAHLEYLADRLRRAGGSIQIAAPVTALDALDAPLIVNCTGIGARDLVPDSRVVPVRGQVVVARNPGLTEFYRAPSPGPDYVYVFPHGDVVVLGGTAEEGDWDLTPRAQTTERILRDCRAVYPQLGDAQVLAERVGLRPYRPEVRLEAEDLGDGRVVWHNYGHGGAGVTLAWGCARELTQAALARSRIAGEPQ
jgi:D-amino-acid oxidase